MKKEVVNRIVLYFAGIAILSLGVVLNIKTNLGTAALNVIPYVISIQHQFPWERLSLFYTVFL